jgi:hypothetical protein
MAFRASFSPSMIRDRVDHDVLLAAQPLPDLLLLALEVLEDVRLVVVAGEDLRHLPRSRTRAAGAP